MYRTQIIKDIRESNPERSADTLSRRLMKILEELGETSEAFLSRTSANNYKKKTWDDYREEAVDTLIVMLDVGLTTYPGGGYPAGSMLDLHLAEGRSNRAEGFAEMENAKFEIARAVCSAQFFLQPPKKHDDTPREAGFIGAISRGVRAAASLCYAKIPGDSDLNLEQRVFDLVQLKLAKWRSGRTTAEALTNPSNEVVEMDQVEYLGQIRERHQ